MKTSEILQSDSWFYTGLPIQQYNNALERGIIEPIDLGAQIQQEHGISRGLIISKGEAFIDGFIEGYLTQLYGEGKFSKLWVRIPQGTALHHDVMDEGIPLSYVVTISIPIEDSAHVETWECGPELVEEVEHEYKMEQEFGRKLPPLPGSGGGMEQELSVTVTEDQLGQAAMEGVMQLECPYCHSETPAEPDADYIYCLVCNKRFKIDNPYI